MKSFDEKFSSAFYLVAFTVNRHLIRHMQRIQTELEIDLQTTYVGRACAPECLWRLASAGA